MPTVHYALTHAVKRQWADYWAMRPTAQPMGLDDVLDNCQPAHDLSAYDFDPAEGAELWEHAEIPDHAFIVKDSGVEWVVVRIVPKKLHRASDLMRRKPKPPKTITVDVTPPQVVTVCHEPAPDLGGEPSPDAPAAERWAWVKVRVEDMSKWLSRNTRANPKYGVVADLNNQMQKRMKGLRLEVERAADEAACAGESPEVMVVGGKVIVLPAVKYLLKAVAQLQARITELERKGA